jgi:glucose/mannose-6-phosphate isomerase
VPEERNPAKQLARSLDGKAALVVGAGMLEPVARCWKGQLNGYAKVATFADALPEANHTTIMGFEFPDGLAERLAVVQLRSSYDHPRVRAHGEYLAAWLRERGIAVTTIQAEGQSRLAQMLWTMACGDWVAYYRALLNGVDPSQEVAIQFVKQRLAATA